MRLAMGLMMGGMLTGFAAAGIARLRRRKRPPLTRIHRHRSRAALGQGALNNAKLCPWASSPDDPRRFAGRWSWRSS
jgi:hypothetical protein